MNRKKKLEKILNNIRNIDKKKFFFFLVIGIIGVSLISIMIVNLGEVVTFPTAQGQIESQIVGLKIGAFKEGSSPTSYDYIDRSLSNSFQTTSYSTWHKSIYLNRYSTANLNPNKWLVDPDGEFDGTCNLEITRQSTSVPCNEYGDELDDWSIKDNSFSIYDSNGNKIKITYLWTDYTSSYTINFYGEHDGDIVQSSGISYLADYTSESRGNYKDKNTKEWASLDGRGSAGIIVFQESMKNLQLGEFSDVNPAYWQHNAYLNAEIVDLELQLSSPEFQGGTIYGANYYPSVIDIPLQTGDISLYSSAEAVLRGLTNSQLPRESETTIDVTSNWIDTVYWGIPYDVLLGTCYDQKGLLGYSCLPFKIASLQINLKTRFRIITNFGSPADPANVATTPSDPHSNTNPSLPGGADQGFDFASWFMEWLNDLFDNPKDMNIPQWIFTIAINIVLIILLVISSPYLLQFGGWVIRTTAAGFRRTAANRRRRRNR